MVSDSQLSPVPTAMVPRLSAELLTSISSELYQPRKTKKTSSSNGVQNSKTSSVRESPSTQSTVSTSSLAARRNPAPNDIPICCHQAELLGYIEEGAVIDLSQCRFVSIVRRVARKFGLRETPTGSDWNVRWTDFPIAITLCQKLLKYQRINHFPGSQELTMKNNFARNYARLYHTFPNEYNFVPETWNLPMDMLKLESFIKTHQKDWFIVKPNEGSCGRGIIITHNLNKLKQQKNMVCQLYVQKPLLINGFKFDLRYYTLITSCQPLRIFVHNEGLARLATEKYEEPNQHNEGKKYVHLTNYCINKFSPSYISDEINGTMRRLTTVKKWLERHNVDVGKVQDSIDDAIIKTIIIFLPALQHYYRLGFPDRSESNSSFEIYGFDILLDQALMPYVLEVNESPGFEGVNLLDDKIIEELLEDSFQILNLAENNRNKVLIEEKRHSISRLQATAQTHASLKKEKQRLIRKLTQSRIDWEDKHMGNFRKIYPSESMKDYDRFITAGQKIFWQP